MFGAADVEAERRIATFTNDAAACVTLEAVGAVHVAGGLAGAAPVVRGGRGAATRVAAAGVLTTGPIITHVTICCCGI